MLHLLRSSECLGCVKGSLINLFRDLRPRHSWDFAEICYGLFYIALRYFISVYILLYIECILRLNLLLGVVNQIDQL